MLVPDANLLAYGLLRFGEGRRLKATSRFGLPQPQLYSEFRDDPERGRIEACAG